MAEVDKIDSNSTGLRFCEEESMGVLPAAEDQVWFPMEPNSYSDFGGEVTTLARRPINASRQNQKGVVVDLDASGGLNQDLTQNNTTRLERGFFFADIREMFDTQAIDNETTDVLTVVAADDTYRLAYGNDLASPKIQTGSLLLASGFTTAGNNGVNTVVSIASTAAAGTLTFTPGVIADDVIEIDNVYYQYAADPTTGTPNGTIGSPYLVDVGVSDTISLANLLAAVNASGTPGVTYSAEITEAHSTVTAVASDATTVDFEAISPGGAGNLISTTVTAVTGADGFAFGAATLTGGTAYIDVDASLTDETAPSGHAGATLTLTPGAIADDIVEVDGVYYTWAADPTTGTPDGSFALPYLVDLGASDTISLANLRKAINASGTAGVTYAAEVVKNARVEAVSSNATTLVARARHVGTTGNTITVSVTEVSGTDGLAWDTATLVGGTEAGSRVQVVGHEFVVSTVDVSMASTLPRLVRASGAIDWSALGLVPGSFIYIGGDDTGESFVNEVNNGWARVKSVAAAYIELDKTTSTMVAETGTGLTVRIFYSKVIKNETAESGLIVSRSFQFERSLDKKDTAIAGKQGEYLVGGFMNEYTMNTKQADKLNLDMTIVAIDNDQRTQADGLKSADSEADARTLVSEDAFNTTSHVARLRMTVLDPTNANPTPLWGFCTDFTITINNNVTPAKAVSRLGAFAVTAGQFDVGGDITAYFSDVAAVTAVRENEDVSFDAIFARDNYGIAFDIPLCALGDARLNVEQDAPIMLPLKMSAAEDRTFHHTLLKAFFNYLPDVAMPG